MKSRSYWCAGEAGLRVLACGVVAVAEGRAGRESQVRVLQVMRERGLLVRGLESFASLSDQKCTSSALEAISKHPIGDPSPLIPKALKWVLKPALHTSSLGCYNVTFDSILNQTRGALKP
jgi:hypothetical protein